MCREGCSFTWRQPCNYQRALWVHHFGGYSKLLCKNLQSLRVACDKRAVNLLKSGEQRYRKVISNSSLCGTGCVPIYIKVKNPFYKQEEVKPAKHRIQAIARQQMMCWNWVGRWQSIPGMQVAILWTLINNGVAMTTVPGPAEELEDGQFVLLRKNEDDNYVTCSAKHAARKQRRSRKQSMVSWEKGSLCQCVCGYVWEECCGYVWEECLRVWWEECVCMCVCVSIYVCVCVCLCVCVGKSVTVCVHTYVGKIVFVFVYMWVLGRLCFSASVSVWVCWEECVYFSASVSVSVCVCSCVCVSVLGRVSLLVCMCVKKSVCMCVCVQKMVCKVWSVDFQVKHTPPPPPPPPTYVYTDPTCELWWCWPAL